jgi:hypothetical protein
MDRREFLFGASAAGLAGIMPADTANAMQPFSAHLVEAERLGLEAMALFHYRSAGKVCRI